MNKIKIIFSFLTLMLLPNLLKAHSVQIQYCISCDGDLRIWVEHWHTNENPNGTSMTISLDINGTTTQQSTSPAGVAHGLAPGQLPGCSTPIIYSAGCPGEQNTYYDWVYYDYTGIPQNVPITFTIISGNTVFTEDGCNMYPLAVTFTIDGVNQVQNQDICSGVVTSSINLPANATWTNDNPAIGIPASGVGPINGFTPVGPVGTTATIDYINGCGTGSYTYTIQPSPNAGQTSTSGGVVSSSTCLGTPIFFQDNSSVPVPYVINGWDWNFGDGNTSTVQNPQHNYANPGTYNVTLTAQSDIGCNSSINFPITVNENPVADFSSDVVCPNNPTTLTDLSNVNNAIIDTWTWDILNDNSTEYTNQNPQNTFTAGGTYDVSLIVETDDGCVSPETIHQVNVDYTPVASFSSDSVCFGSITTMTDQTAVTGSNISTWNWDFGNGVTSNTNPSTFTFANPGNNMVQLEVFSPQGCSAIVNDNIYVRGLPIAAFNLTDSCFYNAIQFNNTSNISIGTMGYNWDFGDGTANSTAINPTHTYASEGIYTINLTTTSNYGCVDNVTHNVSAYVKPVANYTTQPVCVGNTTQIADLSFLPTQVAGDIITSWAWDINSDGTNEYASQNPQHLFNAEGIYNTTLIAFTNYGCTDTIDLPIEIWPLPFVNFNYLNLCHGDITQFSDQSSISNLYTVNNLNTYNWNFGDGTTGNGANPTHVFQNFGDFNIDLEVISDNGCTNNFSQVMPIHPLPVPDFTSTSICVNTPPTTFTNTSIIPTGSIDQIDWIFSNGNNTSGWVVTNTYLEPTSGANINAATLTATSNFGCVNSISHPVIVYEKPTANLTSDETMVCDPGLVKFTDLSFSNTTTIDTWQWDFFNGATSIEQNPEITYYTEDGILGVYDVNLIVSNGYGCFDTVLVSDYITAVPTPIAEFHSTPSLLVITDTEASFVNESLYADEYHWDFGDFGEQSTDFEPTHIYPEIQQTYTPRLIASNYNHFCSDTAYGNVIIKDIVLFYVPNIFTPDNDDFNQKWNTVFTAGVEPYDFRMLVYNRNGELIWESYNQNASWNGHYGGELVADGVYIWKLDFKETMSDKKHSYTGHVTILK